ncbi:MAG: TIGR01212 family radical SAM protein [Calditrichia bacterium]
MKQTYPWGDNRPYYSYATYIKQKFGERIQKVSVDAGFTCPNRDGTKGYGGCIYCNNDSFTPAYLKDIPSIREQIESGKEFLKRRYKANKFIAYFQAYSNTYAPLDVLKSRYEEALDDPEIIGLTLGTRPDCIDENILTYLEDIAKTHYVTIEYGLESIHNKTLDFINRLHTIEEFEEAIQKTANRGIYMGTHLILGLPGESKEMMLAGAEYISRFPLDYVKLHHLHIVEKTVLGVKYKREPFPLFSCMEYVELAAEFIRRTRPDMVFQRIVGETQPRNLIAPNWGIRADKVARLIENHMKEHVYFQGQLYSG